MDAPYSVKAQKFFASAEGKEYLSNKSSRSTKRVVLKNHTEVCLLTPDEMDAYYSADVSTSLELRSINDSLDRLRPPAYRNMSFDDL